MHMCNFSANTNRTILNFTTTRTFIFEGNSSYVVLQDDNKREEYPQLEQ